MWRREDTDSLWYQLWKVKAPPKTLNLLWRALSNCLPTKVVLVRRHVPVSSICPVCHASDKTIYHVLVECNFAAQCWIK